MVFNRGYDGYSVNVLQVANAGATLTIGPGVTVRGQNGVIGSGAGYELGGPANVGVINLGTISCDVSGGTITMTGQYFGNGGLARGINGGVFAVATTGWANSGALTVVTNSVLTLSGTGTNTGTLNLTNGTVNLTGSVTTGNLGMVNQQGGTIELSGTLDNTGNGLVLSGPWELNGGRIRNGTVVATNGYSLVVNNGTLEGVTVNGVLDVGKTYAGALLVVTNGLTLNGTCYVGNLADNSRGRMSFVGSQTLGGNGTVVFNAGYDGWYVNILQVATAGATLTIGPGVTVRGQNGLIGSGAGYELGGPANVGVINLGTISCDVSGGVINIRGSYFIDQGFIGASSGGVLALDAGAILSSPGVINSEPGGTVRFSGNLTGDTGNAAQFDPQGNLEFTSCHFARRLNTLATLATTVSRSPRKVGRICRN